LIAANMVQVRDDPRIKGEKEYRIIREWNNKQYRHEVSNELED
jgi:hypothetical protein